MGDIGGETVRRPGFWTLPGIVAVVLTVGLVGAGIAGAGVAEKKKPSSCTLLKAAQIEKVVGAPVSGPGSAGTLDIACDFDIGPGLGEAGGGSVIVQLYTGSLAKGVWSAAKSGGEKVGKYYWDPLSEIASGWKHGKMVGMSVSYTGGPAAPEHPQVKDQALALLALALKKL